MPPQEREIDSTTTYITPRKFLYTAGIAALGYGSSTTAEAAEVVATSTTVNEVDFHNHHNHHVQIRDQSASWILPTVFQQQIPNKKRVLLLTCVVLLIICASLFIPLYTFHRGFRRNCQFWVAAYPLVVEYRLLKFHAKYICGCKNDKEIDQHLKPYHKRTAPKVLENINRMQGIYIKIGQFLSAAGAGIIDEEYVKALRPLQDGTPPRSYDAIKGIIEESTGKKMEDIFETFEEEPIGSASVAQAHRATLKRPNNCYNNNNSNRGEPTEKRRRLIGRGGGGGDVSVTKNDNVRNNINCRSSSSSGDQVIVKVQYPEVAELFYADMKNLEILTKLLNPQNVDMIRNAKNRHEKELDFTLEAQNLIDCGNNMQKHGLEPKFIRIPRVRNETGICTKHVLVMEYLQGTSLSDAMEQEQDRIARALGKKDAEELRFTIAKQMREHFEKGGGENVEAEVDIFGIGSLGDNNSGGLAIRILQSTGPFAATILRGYAVAKERVDDFKLQVLRIFGGANLIGTPFELSQGSSIMPMNKQQQKQKRVRHVNLGRALKILVRVHGVQLIQDGLFNADPHPGNVLILPDGRLGLLDYGMVGHLDVDERNSIARTVIALAHHDKDETARIYTESGYHVSWKEGEVKDPAMLHRLAASHMDKIDLSPIRLSHNDIDAFGHKHVRKVPVLDFLRTLRVHSTPEWILQVRRLGRLLMGVTAQAARPMSLAKQWESIAEEALREQALNEQYEIAKRNGKSSSRRFGNQKQKQS